MASGWVRSAISPTQSRSFLCVVGASAAMVWLIRRTLLIGFPVGLVGLELDEAEVGVLVADQQGRRFRIAARETDGAGERRLWLDLDVRGAIDRGDLLPLLLDFGFDLILGARGVEHRA